MPRPSPASKILSKLPVTLAKAKAPKAFAILFDALPILVAAGDVEAARRVAAWLFGGRVALPKAEPTSLALSAVDGFAFAAKLGDVTKGRITAASPPASLPLATRVRAAETEMRSRVLTNAYGARGKGDWRKRKESDPFRRIGQWREIQTLATDEATEPRALELLANYLDTLAPDDRGAGYGDELVLALDLELRHANGTRLPPWLERHGDRLIDALFLQTALGLPAIAKGMSRGKTASAMRLSAAEIKTALTALDRALGSILTPS